jgi:hypothetical protein
MDSEQMGTQRVHMIEILPWLARWALHTSRRDFCPSLAALVATVQNIFFLTVCNFSFFVPIAQQVGQAVVQARLSLNVCLWFTSRIGIHFALATQQNLMIPLL